MIKRVQPDVSLPKNKKIRVYTATLTQTGTNIPVVHVKQNTLGYDIIWARLAAGNYEGTLEETILLTNTTVNIAQNKFNYKFTTQVVEPNTFQIFTYTTGISINDNGLLNTLFELKIYDI